MGRIVTAVYVGGLPQLDPSVYGASAPTLYTGCHRNIWRIYRLQGLAAPFTGTVGLDRVLFCYKYTYCLAWKSEPRQRWVDRTYSQPTP